MKSFGELTYDEQRELLGLWQPDFTARWSIAIREFTASLQPVIDAFASLSNVKARQDSRLVGEK